MSTRTIHMSMSVRGVLSWPESEFRQALNWITKNDGTKFATTAAHTADCDDPQTCEVATCDACDREVSACHIARVNVPGAGETFACATCRGEGTPSPAAKCRCCGGVATWFGGTGNDDLACCDYCSEHCRAPGAIDRNWYHDVIVAETPSPEVGMRTNRYAVALLRREAKAKGQLVSRMVRSYAPPDNDDDLDDLDTIRFVASRAWNLARSADELAVKEQSK